MYALNTNFPEGFLCFVGGKLIFRPNIPEKTYIQKFAEVIDTETLKVGDDNITWTIHLYIWLQASTDTLINLN